jgi:histidinol-phosphate aminotransferase
MDKIIESAVRESIKKISPYVPGKPIEELQRDSGIEASKIIKLASNENPLEISPKIKDAIIRYIDNISRYPEGSGYYLKNKLSEYLGVSAEKVILGSGSSEIISMAMETFLNPGEEVLFPSPSFLIYKILAHKTDAKIVEIPLNDDFSYDLNRFYSKITDNTKIIILCNPNNPSGTIIYKEQLEEFFKKLPENIIVICDEAYIEYVEDKNFGHSFPYIEEKNILIARTFSKIYGLAGLRMGYGIAKKGIIDFMERIRPPFNTTGIGQEAAIAALEDTEYRAKSYETNINGKKYLYSELKNLGIYCIPTETNFILCKFQNNASEIVKELEKRGIIVRYMKTPKLEKEYIRITIGTEKENLVLIENLKEILNH